jgi:hypothetical protein
MTNSRVASGIGRKRVRAPSANPASNLQPSEPFSYRYLKSVTYAYRMAGAMPA